MSQKPLDAAIVTSLTCVAGAGVVLALAAVFWGGAAASLGVAIGAMLAVANLWVLALVGRGVLSGSARGKLWVLVGVAKLLALFGGSFLLLRAGLVSGLTLVVGYGALPAGITVGAFLRPADTSVPRQNLVPGRPDEDA